MKGGTPLSLRDISPKGAINSGRKEISGGHENLPPLRGAGGQKRRIKIILWK